MAPCTRGRNCQNFCTYEPSTVDKQRAHTEVCTDPHEGFDTQGTSYQALSVCMHVVNYHAKTTGELL